MPQATKKSSHAAPKIVAKTAHKPAEHKPAEKAAKPSASSLEHTQQRAQHAVKSVANINAGAMKELFSNSTEEAQKAQAKVFAINREGTEVLTRSLDALARTLNDFTALSRDSIDVAVEVTNIVNDISRTANAEMFKYANNNFSDNLDIFSEALGCRNLNDALEITNKWVSSNLNNYFNQSARLADMLFQFASEASEPVNEHLLESAERLSKSLAA